MRFSQREQQFPVVLSTGELELGVLEGVRFVITKPSPSSGKHIVVYKLVDHPIIEVAGLNRHV